MKKMVLLVEDHLDDIELARLGLENRSDTIDLVVKESGEKAVEYLFDAEAMGKINGPALVLLDLNLGGIDGFEVVRRIRVNQATSRIPVVMLTTSNNRNDVERAYDSGANSFITKPVDFGEFRTLINRVVDYWVVTNTGAAR